MACRCGSVVDLRACTRCGKALYCGVACQKEEWPEHRLVCDNTDPADISNDQYASMLNLLRLIDGLPDEESGQFLDMVSLSTVADHFLETVNKLEEETQELTDNIERLKLAEQEIAIAENSPKGLSVLEFNAAILEKRELSGPEISKFLKAATGKGSVNSHIGPKIEEEGITEATPEDTGRDLWAYIRPAFDMLKKIAPEKPNAATRLAWWRDWKTANRIWIAYFDALLTKPTLFDLSKLREFWRHLSAGQFLILYFALGLLPVLATLLTLPFLPREERTQLLTQMTVVLLFTTKILALCLGPIGTVLGSLELARRLTAPDTPGRVLTRWRQGRADIDNLFNNTKHDIKISLERAFERARTLPLSSMETVPFEVYLPAITTNWRADTIHWDRVVEFVIAEFRRCKGTAFDFKIDTRWVTNSLDSSVEEFYGPSDLVSKLEITVWRHEGLIDYMPDPIYASTVKAPTPFSAQRRSRSPTRPE